ncbi:hypothetical protein BJX63DRAFT_436633 [Aspergillus granulosus]|uniref:Uncharacterized protein n=1 Tax=Aspergillus granulosus TaxID=176169 RepID=A0ABR4GXL6_9EURO
MSTHDIIEIDPHKAVPKLRGETNYPQWIEALELVLCSKDPLYWRIFTGYEEEPSMPPLYNLTDASITAELATKFEKRPAEVSAEQINTKQKAQEQRNETLIESHNKKIAKFRRQNYAVIALVQSTLEPSPRSQVSGIRTAVEVHSTLRDLYSATGKNTSLRLYQKLVGMKYTAEQNYNNYLHK